MAAIETFNDSDQMYWLAYGYNILPTPGVKCETYRIDAQYGHCILARRLRGSSIRIKYDRTAFPTSSPE